jgi:hypothetical protein
MKILISDEGVLTVWNSSFSAMEKQSSLLMELLMQTGRSPAKERKG